MKLSMRADSYSRFLPVDRGAAQYIAYVLDQFGWGVDRLRQHYDWSQKDCPHKMRAWNNWNAFKAMVQRYLTAIQTGSAIDGKTPSKPVQSPPTAATGSTHTVVKGDTLWAIAKSNGTTVKNIKALNGLSGDTISVGQVLNISGSKQSSTKTPRIIGNFQTNKYGTQWAKAEGTFTVGSGRIMSRAGGQNGGPWQSSPEGGWVYPGYSVKYDQIMRQDDHIWIRYYQNGAYWFLPVNTWNSYTGAVGDEWGSFS